jgi:hypothetical protein
VADLPPAEGVAALRALADFLLARGAEIRAASAVGRSPRPARDSGRMHHALWRRAVRERQRLAGEDERTASDVVTSAVNHLGHLAGEASWFADERLRESAIDETLRHALLGDRVPSQRAQYLWARYWSTHLGGLGEDLDRDPDRLAARHGTRERFDADLMAAWEAWTASA